MAADVDTSAPPGTVQAQVVSLRGALWRQHTDLRDMEPADARYPDAVNTLLELTAQLLTAEAESSARDRASRRTAALAVAGLGAVLIAASVLAVVIIPGLGGWMFRAVDGAVLTIVVVVLVTNRLRRHTGATPRSDRQVAVSHPETSVEAPAEPETGPLPALDTIRS